MSNITLDLTIDNVLKFLNTLYCVSPNYKINGHSVDSCCLSLYTLWTIEGLSTDFIDTGEDHDQYITLNSNGWVQCDEYNLIYYCSKGIESDLVLPLERWALLFNRGQIRLRIAPIKDFINLLEGIKERNV